VGSLVATFGGGRDSDSISNTLYNRQKTQLRRESEAVDSANPHKRLMSGLDDPPNPIKKFVLVPTFASSRKPHQLAASGPPARGPRCMCTWRASPAKRCRRAGGATSGPPPKQRFACVAPMSTREVEAARDIRSPHSDSGFPPCYAWSRAGLPRREASGSGGAGAIHMRLKLRDEPPC
jgi:hypothetical protein